jgi:uncharacterized lipoprotein YmbA
LSNLAEQPFTAKAKEVSIAIGPVTLPQYLDRPQIVTRDSSNRLVVADLEQWGGHLDDNFIRALGVNLSSLLETDRVSLYPWREGAPADYQVTIDILAFEADTGGNAVLSVFWSIVNRKNGQAMLIRRSTYRNGPSETGVGGQAGNAGYYDGVAAAMSRDLEMLSRDIADAITHLRAV